MSDQSAEGPTRPAELSAVRRLAAGNGLRQHMKDRAGLVPIAEGACAFLYEHFEADAAALTLMRGNWYRTLITVGEESPGQVRHPDGETYPTSEYPTVTETLRSGTGYVCSTGNDGGITESRKFLSDFHKTTAMGAPIGYKGDVVGEVFVSRARGRPHYTGHDLAALLDLARQIGYRIGPAIAAQDVVAPGWWPEDA